MGGLSGGLIGALRPSHQHVAEEPPVEQAEHRGEGVVEGGEPEEAAAAE